MNVLPVNEIFESLQGEAHFTGMPSVFVRLQGCNVGCPWCDTKHTWSVNPNNLTTFDQVLHKVVDDESYANVRVEELAGSIVGIFSARHVVITGGEPCMYSLLQFTECLHALGCTTQIETSGTEPIDCSPNTWVTVSPKLNMPGKRAVLPAALHRANELKMPVGKVADVEALRELMRTVGWTPHGRPVWLQPLSTSEKATQVCIEQATWHGFRVSLQTHKFIGAR